jgi:hypothetical protein
MPFTARFPRRRGCPLCFVLALHRKLTSASTSASSHRKFLACMPISGQERSHEWPCACANLLPDRSALRWPPSAGDDRKNPPIIEGRYR